MDVQYTTGDDGFTRGESLLNRITIWATRKKSEADTLASHQFKFIDQENIMEATRKGVRKITWKQKQEEMEANGVEWCVVGRVHPVVPSDVMVWKGEILKMVGFPYSKSELVLAFMDGMVSKVTGRDFLFFRKMGDISNSRRICSKAANIPDLIMGFLPRQAEYFSPDGTWDYKIERPYTWKVKAHSNGWYR